MTKGNVAPVTVLDVSETLDKHQPATDAAKAFVQLYRELCDLFNQAIFMGRDSTFGEQPDTDPDRSRLTSPQARRFATAAVDAFRLQTWRRTVPADCSRSGCAAILHWLPGEELQRCGLCCTLNYWPDAARGDALGA